MKLEENLKEISKNFPESNLNPNDIYKKANINDNKTINKKYVIFASIIMAVITLMFTIPYLTLNNKNNNNLVKLLSEISETKTVAEPENYADFIIKYNNFSSKIADYALDYDTKDNTVISPYSIFSCLVLLSAIADNDSKTEILNALNMDEKLIIDNYPYFYSLHNYENTISQEKTYNSIFIQNDLKIKNDCINNLANNYYCYQYQADFKNNFTNKMITDYVSKNTNGLINEDFEISKEAIAVLINSLYLKTIWNEPLQETENSYNFKNNDLSITSTKLYKTDYSYGKVKQENNYSHFYCKTKNNYKMKIILPNEGINISDIFDNELISYVNNYHNYDDSNIYTRCVFPKFKLESSLLGLKELLNNKLGIKKIFDSANADLSKLFYINPNDNVYVDEIKHKSVLEVDEKGIVGASVTMAIIAETTAIIIEKKEDFIIDKSFGVIITNKNDEILFTGIIDKI